MSPSQVTKRSNFKPLSAYPTTADWVEDQAIEAVAGLLCSSNRIHHKDDRT